MTELAAGLSIGLGAGLTPGPLLTLVFTSSIERGFGAGFRVAALETLLDRVPWATWLNPLSLGGEEDRRARSLFARADPAAARTVCEEGPDGMSYLKRRVVLVAHLP